MDWEIVVKNDCDLTLAEIDGIFLVYNECFYDNGLVNPEHIQTAKKSIGKQKIWQWYFARLKKTRQIVGIANFVYDYVGVDKKLSVNRDQGENLTSVATLKNYQGLGISKAIMTKLLEDHADVDLVVEIRKDDKNCAKLFEYYRNFGFSKKSENAEAFYFVKKP